EVDRRWNGCPQQGKQVVYTINRFDNIRPWLLEYIYHHCGLAVRETGIPAIFERIFHLRNIRQAYWSAFLKGHDQRPVLLRFEELIRCRELPGMLCVRQLAFRAIGIG